MLVLGGGGGRKQIWDHFHEKGPSVRNRNVMLALNSVCKKHCVEDISDLQNITKFDILKKKHVLGSFSRKDTYNPKIACVLVYSCRSSHTE